MWSVLLSLLTEGDSVSSRGFPIPEYLLSERRIPFHTQVVTSLEERLGRATTDVLYWSACG